MRGISSASTRFCLVYLLHFILRGRHTTYTSLYTRDTISGIVCATPQTSTLCTHVSRLALTLHHHRSQLNGRMSATSGFSFYYIISGWLQINLCVCSDKNYAINISTPFSMWQKTGTVCTLYLRESS